MTFVVGELPSDSDDDGRLLEELCLFEEVKTRLLDSLCEGVEGLLMRGWAAT